MNITFSNQRHATLTNKQTQSKTQSKLKNSDCIHYIIDHVAFFQFFSGYVLGHSTLQAAPLAQKQVLRVPEGNVRYIPLSYWKR